MVFVFQLETNAVEIYDTNKTLRLNGACHLPRIKFVLVLPPFFYFLFYFFVL